MRNKDKSTTLGKVHESNLSSLIRDHRQALESLFGDRFEQVVATWYAQERQRFEFPDGPGAGPAAVLDFVPILTRRAVEERIRLLLEQGGPALEGAA